MKHLLSILLICSIGFTQELTVDGNLNVTGNIQNQTIDSLLQVITDLQSQIALLGGNGNSEISAKIIEIPVNITSNVVDHTLSINEITGESQDWYRLSFVSAEFSDNGSESMNCDVTLGVDGLPIEIDNDFATPNQPITLTRVYNGTMEINLSDRSSSTFIISDSNPEIGIRTSNCQLNGGGNWTGSVTVKFIVESNF